MDFSWLEVLNTSIVFVHAFPDVSVSLFIGDRRYYRFSSSYKRSNAIHFIVFFADTSVVSVKLIINI